MNFLYNYRQLLYIIQNCAAFVWPCRQYNYQQIPGTGRWVPVIPRCPCCYTVHDVGSPLTASNCFPSVSRSPEFTEPAHSSSEPQPGNHNPFHLVNEMRLEMFWNPVWSINNPHIRAGTMMRHGSSPSKRNIIFFFFLQRTWKDQNRNV